MRTIHRDIVGGFIFSKDGKFLLGKNRKGGVYEGSFVVPGGGVDEGETKEIALHREMLEETGIDINKAAVKQLYQSSGEHEKTLRDTGERVFVKMDFYNYRIDLDQNADEVVLKTEDDWYQPRWFSIEELKDASLRTCSKSPQQQRHKGQQYQLQAGVQLAFAVLPEPATLF
jgi:8-oxo-dGTP pyrophosphatase MutT (NUDIX family)